MSDFVTRLESELRRAALRQERVGWPRRVALPRLRALGGPAATAVAILSAALVVAAVATVFLRSELERPAGGAVPTELAGTWQLPASAKAPVERAPAELRLSPQGAGRCTGLGAGSKPCYAIDNARGGTLEWGTFSVSGAQITFRATVRAYCGPDPCFALGVYSWRVNPGTGSLYLTLLGDELRDRARTLSTGPLTRRATRRSRTGGPQTASHRNATATPSAIPATGRRSPPRAQCRRTRSPATRATRPTSSRPTPAATRGRWC